MIHAWNTHPCDMCEADAGVDDDAWVEWLCVLVRVGGWCCGVGHRWMIHVVFVS